MFFIYAIIFPNKKKYIGLTTDFKQRKYTHINNAHKGVNNPLYNAIRDWGIKNLKWEILEQLESRSEAFIKELDYIKTFDTTSITYGYNTKGLKDFERTNNRKIREVINVRTEEVYSSVKASCKATNEKYCVAIGSTRRKTVTKNGNLFIYIDEWITLSEIDKKYFKAISEEKYTTQKRLSEQRKKEIYEEIFQKIM